MKKRNDGVLEIQIRRMVGADESALPPTHYTKV